MPSFFRFVVAGAICVSMMSARVATSAIGSMPSQTIGGFGHPIYGAAESKPTAPPRPELVRGRLRKKDVTNDCTEWTIPGGFGTPECSASETCLFTSVGNYYYEGCGETSIRYDWITSCWNYPKAATSSPPASETYCPVTAPYCGYYAFVFDDDVTAYNFGCSTVSYSYYVELLATDSSSTSTTDIILNGGGGSSLTASVGTTRSSVTQRPQTSQIGQTTSASAFGAASTTDSTGSSTTPNSTPSIGSHKKSSTPIGAIVGGVVGGVAVIALIAFFTWFFLRKRKQDKAAQQANIAQIQTDQQNAATAASMNHNRISEIDGAMKPSPPPNGNYVPQPNITGVYGEKPAAVGENTQQDVYRPVGGANLQSHPNSPPPPVYAQPGNPPRGYNELEHQNANVQRPVSVPPVSPVGTQGVSPVATPSPAQQYQHMNATELAGQSQTGSQDGYSPRPGFQEVVGNHQQVQYAPQQQQQNYQQYSEMPSQHMAAIPMQAAVPMQAAGSSPVQHVQGMNAAVPMQVGGQAHELGGSGGAAASGGVNRVPGQTRTQRYDMNGNLMGEYGGAELE